jgi:hypothetical protein
MERIVTTWQENGMQYTITAKPINNTAPVYTGPPNEMVSIYEYIGSKTPEKGIGDKVYKKAKQVDAKIGKKEVITTNYSGKILLYERVFLDMYYNAVVGTMNTTPIVTPQVVATTPVVETKTYEYDTNNDDLPF